MSDRAAESSSSPEPLPPQVSDYDLIRPIGEGGFGRVWLASNRATGHLRAVKVIALRRSGTAGMVDSRPRLSEADPAGREIASITRLEANLRCQHPNLLNIHHVGKTAEHLFYVMDLADDVSGGPASGDPGYRPATLHSRLEGGPLPPEECLRYARQLLAGLASLHQAGVIHRDVKPANCLFVGGHLKLADFGLLAEDNPEISRVGTHKYMPPDGRMDARADVYAAGLVIYEMTTGLPAESFPRPGHRAPQSVDDPILGALTRLCLRACQPDPRERFQDAGEMLAQLEAADPQAVARRVRNRRQAVAAITGAGVVVVLVAALAVWVSRPQRVHVNFVTYPFEAAIYLDDVLQLDAAGNPYRTPCTIEDLPARVHRVAFEHERLGRRDAGERDFARERRIEARWSPVL